MCNVIRSVRIRLLWIVSALVRDIGVGTTYYYLLILTTTH